MIKSILIKNIVLIEKLSLELEKGLLIFSGETGAGKSIILSSLGLALGRRSEPGLIRNSANEGSVSIEFDIKEDHPAYLKLKDLDLIEGETLILRRVLDNSGKSRAFINDRKVTLSFLRDIGSSLLEIHGQNEKIGLLDPSSHLAILDKFGDYKELLIQIKEKHAICQKLEKIYYEANKIKENRMMYEEDLKNKINLIKNLNLKKNEEEELSNKKNLLNHYEKIFLSINEIYSILNDDNGNYNKLASNGNKLEKIIAVSGKLPEIESIVQSLNVILIEAKEILGNINLLKDNFQYDEKEIENIEHRLFDINNISRKLNTKPSVLNEKLLNLENELNSINENEENIEKINTKLKIARESFKDNCEELTNKREKTAENLQDLVNKELEPLKLQDAKFRVNITTKEKSLWNAMGQDNVSFFVRLNKGLNEGEIHKVSSGGELSRLMLALNLVLAKSLNNKTLIFDEIDSGVSGAVADAIGKRLQELSKHQQTLVITHLPQVASRGKHHYRSYKIIENENTYTYLEKLNSSQRVLEIAKMISGHNITEEAKIVANKLMKEN